MQQKQNANCVIITLIIEYTTGGIVMEELVKQVRGELIRTTLWAIIAMGAGVAAMYIIW